MDHMVLEIGLAVILIALVGLLAAKFGFPSSRFIF